MVIAVTPVEARPVAPLRPVARWIPTVDENGRGRLTMQWRFPDADEALRSLKS